MIQAVANQPFEAVLGGQPSGISAVLSVEVYDPTTGSTVIAPSGAGIIEPRPGTYRVSKTILTPGDYRIRWERTDTSAVLSEEEIFVSAGHPATPAGPNQLLSVDELRLALGIDPSDHSQDERYEQAIAFASRIIINYTERDFGAPLVTEQRVYEYDGSGYLDIDDATAISGVALTVPNATDRILAADEWRPMPNRRDDSPVFYYIAMPGIYGLPGSPEMGFLYNLDVYARDGRWIALPPHAKVSGTWGWPAVPEDVKRAAILVIGSLFAQDSNKQSESIANYSYTLSPYSVGAEVALSGPVKDLLAPYMRIQVG